MERACGARSAALLRLAVAVGIVVGQCEASRLMKQPAASITVVNATDNSTATERALRAVGQAALPATLPASLPLAPLVTPKGEGDYEVLLTLGMSIGVTFVLYGVAILVGLAASFVALLVVYDVGRCWCHHSHFRACERKLKRVHEAFLKERTEFHLCPCCVEPLTNQASQSKVVFLCGHRFHISCANAWFRENPQNATRCPICLDDQNLIKDADADGEGSTADEAQHFILRSLSRHYPEFIPESLIRRWANCGTETWVQELSMPRYNSFLKAKLTQATSDSNALSDTTEK